MGNKNRILECRRYSYDKNLINDGDLSDNDITDIQNSLDEANIDYDWDSGNRLMVNEEDELDTNEILDNLGYSYDCVV